MGTAEDCFKGFPKTGFVFLFFFNFGGFQRNFVRCDLGMREWLGKGKAAIMVCVQSSTMVLCVPCGQVQKVEHR